MNNNAALEMSKLIQAMELKSFQNTVPFRGARFVILKTNIGCFEEDTKALKKLGFSKLEGTNNVFIM